MSGNPELDLARSYVTHTGASLFLTGKAGTGKTTFLRDIDAHCAKRHVVLAPTGVAAVNAGGVTIHSFFQLPFEPYLPDVPELVTEYQMPQRKGLNKNKINIIRTLELLIIDEVSMVRADLLDAIDAQLRRYRRSALPFGGVQLLLIGDVHQLSPVVTERERPYIERVYPSPYFFSSKALQRVRLVTIELARVYRQQDAAFVQLLNRVRDNRIDAQALALLNSRVGSAPQGAITLTTHNHQADAINRSHMEALRGESRTFEARVKGSFSDSAAPVDRSLTLKVGERVMFVKNDSSGGHRYYNGLLGTVAGFRHADGTDGSGAADFIEVTDDDGDTLLVGREQWEALRYTIGPDNQITQQVEGAFSQYPLRPAWAVTIHKAQGLTFDRVAIDAADAFAFGQVYVALSRCRTLEGLTLTKPLTAAVAFNDEGVQAFVDSCPPLSQTEADLSLHEAQYYHDQLNALFSLDALCRAAELFAEPYAKHLKSLYPNEVAAVGAMVDTLAALQSVSLRFAVQLSRLPREEHPARIASAAQYYLPRLASLNAALPAWMEVEVDNKEHRRLIADRGGTLREQLAVKTACMREAKEHGFSIEGMQRARTAALLADDGGARPAAGRARKADADLSKADATLADLLREWRRARSASDHLIPYNVLPQKALLGIAATMPRNERELLAVKGMGKVLAARYGKEILDIVADYRETQGIR